MVEDGCANWKATQNSWNEPMIKALKDKGITQENFTPKKHVVKDEPSLVKLELTKTMPANDLEYPTWL